MFKSHNHSFVLRLTLILSFIATLILSGSTLAVRADTADAFLDDALRGDLRLDDPLVRAQAVRLAPQLASSQRYALVQRYYEQIIQANNDLEALAQITEFAADLSGGNAETFMLDMSRLTLDATSSWDAIAAGPWGRLEQRIHAHLNWFPGYPALERFGSTGFRADDGSNQVQHLWYSVAIAFKRGATMADLEAQYHEWNPPGLLKYLPGTGRGDGSKLDLTLSRQGIALGRALATNRTQPSQVGLWLRQTLGEGCDKAATIGR
jgi:hypothetical protein